MNDLQICKRIAEIEGVKVESIEFSHVPLWRVDCGRRFEYNPLTDDALCFALMVKYKVWRWSNPYCGVFNVCIKGVQGWITSTTFNKAILLAIIEAHKDGNAGAI